MEYSYISNIFFFGLIHLIFQSRLINYQLNITVQRLIYYLKHTYYIQ